MLDITNCNLCPRRCGVNRTQRAGFCGAGDKVRIALVSLHQWEEPCLVGDKGAGTVFFSHCNLRCVYCQNHEISHGGKGQDVSTERLAEIFGEQQARGAATLDLVTPTHYVPQILAALDIARAKGFRLPVVYNSSGYETREVIEALRGYVDIFLPDLKYRDAASAGEYSAAADYFAYASEAIRRMVEITGPVQFDGKGQMKRGVLVRHMLLPGHRHESMAIVKWLWENFGRDIQVSLMNQYTPMYKAADHKKINRRLTTFEYESVVDYALSLGLENAYVQERRSASKEFVPDFNGTGVLPKNENL
ncbi:MAG: radical SAM protein [Selenomonas sp.]|uniref:radical SAM protein n=1 Tax=Selenomonas sp. TaxID=2053611 RepID=UPI0025E50B7A|nr:radical SAM protein [Selenomonas sp.]MCR5757866.1 radical SAM protein [Selenomonas sp.]